MDVLGPYTLSEKNKENYLLSRQKNICKTFKDVMLCARWDHCVVIHFKFLNCNQGYILNNYNMYMKIFWENAPLSSIGGTLCFSYDNARPHAAWITQEKYCILAGLFYPIHHIHQTFHHLFPSLRNVLNNKKFSQEDQVKKFVGNYLSRKPAEFYLREINKLLDKWQELILNNGK